MSAPPVQQPSPAPTPMPPPTAKPFPRGIFNSAAIKGRQGDDRTAVTPLINNLDVVNGTLVKVSWSDINPAPGSFDFTAIDEEIELAQALNSRISLIVLDSKEMPDFVRAACTTFDYQFRGRREQTCLPWDENYLTHKQALVESLGAAFDDSEVLEYVYITYAAMTNGAEMHWRVDERAFTAAGYSSDKLANAYHQVTDFYAEAFATTPLVMEVHAVFNRGDLAASAWEHCDDVSGQRCGVAIWWCATRLATNPMSAEYAVFSVAQQAAEQTFAVCQTIGSMTDQPARFNSEAGYTSLEVFDIEMAFFLAEGFSVFELWTSDIRNEAMQQRLRDDVLPYLP